MKTENIRCVEKLHAILAIPHFDLSPFKMCRIDNIGTPMIYVFIKYILYVEIYYVLRELVMEKMHGKKIHNI